MRRLPPHLAPAGYSPRRYAPLSPAPVLGMGERLTDLRDIQQMFARGELGGYWPADPQYAYEDSAGTTLASVNGVVGYRADVACGKHAIQATTANKPYLRRTPQTGKYWYDSNTATGAMTVTFSGSLGSACTIATVTPEGVTIAENQTVGSTYNIAPPYGYNSDVLIINRALTAAEKALVTRVMQRSVPTLGSELVTNGTFDNGLSGWMTEEINGGVPGFPVVTSGAVQVIREGTNQSRVYQLLLSEIGAWYRFRVDSSLVAGATQPTFYKVDSIPGYTNIITFNNINNGVFASTAATTYMIFAAYMYCTAAYDNFSFRRIV